MDTHLARRGSSLGEIFKGSTPRLIAFSNKQTNNNNIFVGKKYC